MFFIGSTILVLPDMVLKSSSSCVFRLSSVIAYPILGLGYTILRQLFNPIFTVLLTRNLLFESGSYFRPPIIFLHKIPAPGPGIPDTLQPLPTFYRDGHEHPRNPDTSLFVRSRVTV